MDIDCEELENFNVDQLNNEEDNVKFTIINLALLDLGWEDSEDVRNAPATSACRQLVTS